MFKASTALFLYAETSVHAGSGESLGAIDLAIQRERYTGFPCVAAQGIKGPVRDWFERKYNVPEKPKPDELNADQNRVLAAFGPGTSNASDHAGAVAFTDARILLFPVRSMKGVFAWITCPFVLGRLRRDLALADGASGLDTWAVPQPDVSQALGADAEHACKTTGGKVLLEEEVFTYDDDKPKSGETNSNVQTVADWLKDCAFPAANEYSFWQERIASHLLILRDDDFRHFVKTSTEVQARVALGTGKSTDTAKGGNLFYQENLPPETLLYSVVLAADSMKPRVDDDAKALLDFIRDGVKDSNGKPGLDGHRLQIGGDETTGKGYVYAQFLRDTKPTNSTETGAPQATTEEATP